MDSLYQSWKQILSWEQVFGSGLTPMSTKSRSIYPIQNHFKNKQRKCDTWRRAVALQDHIFQVCRHLSYRWTPQPRKKRAPPPCSCSLFTHGILAAAAAPLLQPPAFTLRQPRRREPSKDLPIQFHSHRSSPSLQAQIESTLFLCPSVPLVSIEFELNRSRLTTYDAYGR